MFNSVGTIKEAFFSAKLWMNLIFVGGTCGIIDYFILGFEYIYNPSTARQLQILINQNQSVDYIDTKTLPKAIRSKIENYNEFRHDEEENLKKETTRRINNNNEERILKIKNGSSYSSENINNYDTKENKTLENKLIKKRNNFPPDNEGIPSIENSNGCLIPKKTSDNTIQKKSDSKTNDCLGTNEVIYYNNQISKKKDEDNHSRSVLINNKKGCVDEINSSSVKQYNSINNHKSIYS